MKTSIYTGVYRFMDKKWEYWAFRLQHEHKVYSRRCVSEKHAASMYNKKCEELGLFEKMYEL